MTMNDEIIEQNDSSLLEESEALKEDEAIENYDAVEDLSETEKIGEAPIESETPIEKEPSVEKMLSELKALREELLEKRKAFEKMSRDIGEFEELFPEKKVNEIPDTVWESVKTGIPLAAAYALYERKNALRIDTARSTNEANSARTTGPIGRDATENYYTPDEVRAMSRSEVKRNYSKILESMKKWN